MLDALKNKLANIFWNFVFNLVEILQEMKHRVIEQKPFRSIRKIIKEINSMPLVVFFWVSLRTEEKLLDFSKAHLGIIKAEVTVQKGQHRLERKMVRWGSNNTEMPWLVLENTTIGAREDWWQSRNAVNQMPPKLDADL